MIDKLGRCSRVVSLFAAALACAALLALIGVTLYEVTMRYAFRAPTRWAFDLAWMLNGASFLLAASYALRRSQHVAIDVFSNAMPPRLRQGVAGFVFLLLFLPSLLFLASAAWEQAYSAYITGEIIRASPWQAVIWPFRLVVAVAFSTLILEALVQGLASAAEAVSGRPAPDGAR